MIRSGLEETLIAAGLPPPASRLVAGLTLTDRPLAREVQQRHNRSRDGIDPAVGHPDLRGRGAMARRGHYRRRRHCPQEAVVAGHHRFLHPGAGLVVGAASLAEPDSWWAKRFYDERKLERAAHPERHLGSRRAGTAAAVGSILLSIVVLGLFAAYPSPILGVDGRSLEYSVGGASILDSKPCRKKGDGMWTCLRWDSGGSSALTYRVKVDSLGCWTAERLGTSSEGSRRALSGCITIRDHIRLFDRLTGYGGAGAD